MRWRFRASVLLLLSGCWQTGHGGAIRPKPAGTVYVWGTTGFYLIGRLPKGKIEALSDVVDVAAGSIHLAALRRDGTVWAWGQNTLGEMGDGTRKNRLRPVQVRGLSDIVSISASFGHALALRRDATVWAWGHNSHGQLGDGTTEARLAPVQVKGLRGVVAISAGRDHSTVLKSDGTVWAWGSNASGQVNEALLPRYLAPVRVTGLSDVKAISDGYTHCVALKKDGTVWTRGFGSRKPRRVAGLRRVKAVAAGAWFALALKEDGTLWAWGNLRQAWRGIDYAKLLRAKGRNTPLGKAPPPELPAPWRHLVVHRVMDWDDVTAIAAETRATVVRRDGSVWEWGRHCPFRRVPGVSAPLALSTGWHMTLAVIPK